MGGNMSWLVEFFMSTNVVLLYDEQIERRDRRDGWFLS